MRIGVVGAGAVGGTLAALLDRAGHDVVVTARGEGLAAIRDHGLRLDGGWGEHSAHVTASETLADPVELLIVAVKAPDLADALRANRSAATRDVLVVRNGLGAIRDARAVLGDGPSILGGLALYAASIAAPGRVTVTAPASLYLGGSPTAPAVARVLADALPTHVVEPFENAEWTKLVVNQVNALAAITGTSVQETIADGGLRRILTRSIRETIGIARAKGIRFEPLQGLSDGLLRMVSLVPEPIAEVLPRLMARRMGAVPNPGSTLQSIRRGRPTEIDWLNGAVVAAATEVGRAAPINAALTDMVHEVERTGRFLTASDIIRRV